MFRIIPLSFVFFSCFLFSKNLRAQAFEPDLNKYVWDLSLMYKDESAWEVDRKWIAEQVQVIKQISGSAIKTSRDLANLMDSIYTLRSHISKLYIYTVLNRMIDIKNAAAAQRFEQAGRLESDAESVISFSTPVIASIGETTIRKWMLEEPRLELHRRRINRIFREAPFQLNNITKPVAEIWAGIPRFTSNTYWTILDAPQQWPVITTQNNERTEITASNYTRLRRSENRNDRTRIMDSYLSHIKRFENTFAALYSKRIEADLNIALNRNFGNGMDAIWFLRDGMPEGSADAPIQFIFEHKSTLQRYAQLRKKLLNIDDQFSYADLYAPAASLNSKFPIDESIAIAINALAPIGENYRKLLQDAARRPWFHAVPSPSKRIMYGTYPSIAGSPAYTVMTFNSDNPSSKTLAGALALTVAFTNIPVSGRPDTRDDPGIYSNAIIYTARIMHDEYLLTQAKTKEEKIYHIQQLLSLFWSSFYSNAILTALDKHVQDLVKKREFPSGVQISAQHLANLREIYGHDKNIVRVDDTFGSEWILNTVTFNSYEAQFWAPAMAAGCVIAERIKSGDDKARKVMYEALGRGNLDLSYHLLLNAGIDMLSNEVYKSVDKKMNALMDQLELLLNTPK